MLKKTHKTKLSLQQEKNYHAPLPLIGARQNEIDYDDDDDDDFKKSRKQT